MGRPTGPSSRRGRLSSSNAGTICTPLRAGGITLRAKDSGGGEARCAGYAVGYDLSADPGHDTVWEIAPVNSGVGDLALDAVHIYTTLFPGCKLYLTAPSGDGCVDATVALQPLLRNMQLLQRWALTAVTGKPGRYSVVALVCV